MLASIAQRWWVVLLRGIFAMLFGCIAFAWPAITLTALVIVFGVYATIDGVAAIAIGFDSASLVANGHRGHPQPRCRRPDLHLARCDRRRTAAGYSHMGDRPRHRGSLRRDSTPGVRRARVAAHPGRPFSILFGAILVVGLGGRSGRALDHRLLCHCLRASHDRASLRASGH